MNKVWWHAATLFVILIFSSTYTHSITLIKYIYRGSSHRYSQLSGKNLRDAEQGIELGPASALQQAESPPF
jgi:hypothetical protein